MFPERTSEAVVPFRDGCVNVWLWRCALTHLWLAAFSFVDLGLSVCLFVSLSTFIPTPRRGPAKLSIAKVTQVDFPPKEVVSYSKETQTPTMSEQKEGEFWPWKHSQADVSLLPTCLLLGHHVFFVFSAMLLPNILLLLILFTNSCFL